MTDNNDWKKVSGAKTDSWNPDVEKEIMGVYVEKKTGVGKYMKNLYILELADGTRKGVWGSAQVDRALSPLEIGMEVRIIFMGKVVNPTTGQPVKNFEFFIRKPKAKTAQAEQPVQGEDGMPF